MIDLYLIVNSIFSDPVMCYDLHSCADTICSLEVPSRSAYTSITLVNPPNCGSSFALDDVLSENSEAVGIGAVAAALHLVFLAEVMHLLLAICNGAAPFRWYVVHSVILLLMFI